MGEGREPDPSLLADFEVPNYLSSIPFLVRVRGPQPLDGIAV